MRRREINQRCAIITPQRHWFFDKHILSCTDGIGHERIVRFGGSGHDHGLDCRVIEHLLERSGDLDTWVLDLVIGPQPRIAVADSPQRSQFCKISNQVPAPRAGAHDSKLSGHLCGGHAERTRLSS